MEPGQLVTSLMQAWETGDTARLDRLFVVDAVYDDVANDHRFAGVSEIRGYVEHVHSWASDVSITITDVHAGPAHEVAEWIMEGVQDRPIPQRVTVATGRRFQIRGATLVEVEDERIIRAADYLDVASFALHLGARLVLPGGTVLEHGDPPDAP